MEGVALSKTYSRALPRCVNLYIAFKYSTYPVVYLTRRNDLVKTSLLENLCWPQECSDMCYTLSSPNLLLLGLPRTVASRLYQTLSYHLGGAAKTIPLGARYCTSVPLAASSLLFTSFSSCATVQQQQQHPFRQSLITLPAWLSILYALRIRACWIAARIPLMPHRRPNAVQEPLTAV
jgi:hypothetical protein